MQDRTPPAEAGLPGGQLGDDQPIERPDGGWEWTRPNREQRHDRNRCRAVWHAAAAAEAEGWYVLVDDGSELTDLRIGPLTDVWRAANALRDLFPAPREADRATLQYMEGRAARIIEAGLGERVEAAAVAYASMKTAPPLSVLGANPAKMLDRLQAACDERRAWLDG